MNTWKELILNGVEVTLHLDTKRHVWEIWVGPIWSTTEKLHYRDPDLKFTKAKGACVLEFLERLKEVQRSANSKDLPKMQ